MKEIFCAVAILLFAVSDARSEESIPFAIQLEVGGESVLAEASNAKPNFRTGIGVGVILDQQKASYPRLKGGLGALFRYGQLPGGDGKKHYFDAASQAWLAWNIGGWYLGGRLGVTMRNFSHTRQWGGELGLICVIPLASWFLLGSHLDYLFFLPGDAGIRHQPAHALNLSVGPIFAF